MSTAILTSDAVTSPQWIISKREDLTWFVGSSLIGYFALAALFAGFPATTFVLVWGLALNGPHLFTTATRTYFDKSARQRLGWRLWLIVPFLLVGPVMYLAGMFGLFFLALVIGWGQYHTAKQHLGFVMLYKRKANERSGYLLDRRYTLTALVMPWILYMYGSLGFPASREVWLVSLILFSAFTIYYLTKQTGNIPKLLLLAVVVPLQWIAFAYASTQFQALMIGVAATNIGHSIQYQRLTWFHNQNRYDGKTKETIGLAALINSRVVFFLLTGIVLNLVFTYIPKFAPIGNQLLLASFLGINLTHYYVDSLIWRTRDDRELAAALHL